MRKRVRINTPTFDSLLLRLSDVVAVHFLEFLEKVNIGHQCFSRLPRNVLDPLKDEEEEEEEEKEKRRRGKKRRGK